MNQTLELPVSELKRAFAGLSKIISTRITLPVLEYIRVEPGAGNTVSLQATDRVSFATWRIPVEHPADFAASLVGFEPLARLVRGGKDKIALVRDENGQVKARYWIGGSPVQQAIATMSLAEWPSLPRIKAEPFIVGPGFKQALREAMECAGMDPNRHILNGACLELSRLPEDACSGPWIRLLVTAGQLNLGARGNGSEVWTEVPVPGVTIDGRDNQIILDRTVLSKALRFGFTELAIKDQLGPMVFRAAAKMMVAMPMRMGGPVTQPPVDPPQTENRTEAADPSNSSAEERETQTDERDAVAATPASH